MKKLTYIFAVALIVAGINSTVNAQGISIGGGISYGFDIEEIGIQLSGTYGLNEDMRVGADIIYYLIGDESFFGEEISTTALEVNFNYNYIFYNENDLIIYGLGTLGIHYFSSSFSFNGFSESFSDTEIGLGLGAGLEYDLGSVKIYAEPRIFLSGFDQFQFNAGVRVPI
ncbi:MAG: outer membrane beta-barrel protein [Balneolaceae bacterium]|nr:outer membrane beta-barrel protein [Balneolaceae bacterium]